MASITQNKKNGKVISYKFTACVGRDEFGKPIFRCTTWKAPEGLIPSRAEKAAQKAAAEWEQKARVKESSILVSELASHPALFFWKPVQASVGKKIRIHSWMIFYRHKSPYTPYTSGKIRSPHLHQLT